MSDHQEWRNRLIDLGVNPFGNDNVGDPWSNVQDVSSIHEREYNRIKRIINDVSHDSDHRSKSVVIVGQPGSGKSHLLNRIRKNISSNAYFTFVEPMVSDDDYWIFMQRQIVGSLLKRYEPNPRYRQLHYLICRGIYTLVKDTIKPPDDSFHPMLGENPINLHTYLINYPYFEDYIIQLLEENDSIRSHTIRDHAKILLRFLDRSRSGYAKSWLNGLGIDEDGCESLGIGHHYASEEYKNDQAYNFLRDLAFLSQYDRPIVLCFDQLDSYTRRNHEQKIINYGTIVETIVSNFNNFVCISAMLGGTQENYQRLVEDPANHDRLFQNRLSLQPINDLESVRAVVKTMFELRRSVERLRDCRLRRELLGPTVR